MRWVWYVWWFESWFRDMDLDSGCAELTYRDKTKDGMKIRDQKKEIEIYALQRD